MHAHYCEQFLRLYMHAHYWNNFYVYRSNKRFRDLSRYLVGLCLGFVTESNKPFIRFGVTGTDIKEHYRSYQKK